MTEILFADMTKREPTVQLKQDRYRIGRMHKQGAFGIIFEAEEVSNGERVAIKTYDPSKEGWEALRKNDLDISDVARRDRRKRAAAANLVPATTETDDNGVLFGVMPFCDRKLSTVLIEAAENPGKKSLPSGLKLEEILLYGADVVNAAAEYQRYEGRAHLDITATNTLIDNITGKLLLSDPATTRGHPFVRSPHVARSASSPLSADGYGLASLLVKMYTGKYLLEEEITEAHKEGGMQSIDAFLSTLDTSTQEGAKAFESHLGAALSHAKIPKNIKKFIRDAAWQRFDDAQEIQREYLAAVKRDDAREVRKGVLKTLGIAAGIGAIAVGAYVLGVYFKPVPEYTRRIEAEAMEATTLDFTKVKDSRIKLVFEAPPASYIEASQEYVKPIVELSKEEIQKRKDSNKARNRTILKALDPDDSYVGVISRSVLESAAELGVELPWELMRSRYKEVFPGSVYQGPPSIGLIDKTDSMTEAELLRYFVGRGLAVASSTDNSYKKVDAENALVLALAGVRDMMLATNVANSSEFLTYRTASRYDVLDNWMYGTKGYQVIGPDLEKVILLSCARLQEVLPQDKYSVQSSPQDQ